MTVSGIANSSAECELDARPIVRMRALSKRFGHAEVLRGVELTLYPGEVHILAGENGAGKSTLVKILGGVHSTYGGTIELAGEVVRFGSPSDANAHGIAVIYQELSLVPTLSIVDNLFLGSSRTRCGGFVCDREQRDLAAAALRRVGLDLDVRTSVDALSIAQQQLVEIAKALARDARVIIMDEPTSALGAAEVDRLFQIIDDLKRGGTSIVYISHKMEEIERIGDRITVLRDGTFVGTALARDLPPAKLIEWMIGRPVGEQFPRHASHGGAVCLAVNGFSVRSGGGRFAADVVSDASFTLHRGEIVGISGLQGSGASELLGGLFGMYGGNAVRGTVTLDGIPLRIRGPRDAIAQGVALLTNDRKRNGLVLSMSVLANATLASLANVSPAGWRRGGLEREAIEPLARSLRLNAAALEKDAVELSGGNQQKAALAKWLATRPKVMLLDEPTRGIDIGAKREIYQLMNEWTARGISILLVTTELAELLALSDRILVMHRGRIAADLPRAQATPQRILMAAMGEVDEVAANGVEARG